MNAMSLFRFLALPAVAASALLLSACSTVQTRTEANPAIIARLSPADRALVATGRVREGLSKDGVFIAWGRPDRIYSGVQRGANYEAWIYTTREVRYVGGYGAFPSPYRSRLVYSRRSGRYFIADFGDPFFYQPTVSVEVPFRKVQFLNGKVVAFSQRN